MDRSTSETTTKYSFSRSMFKDRRIVQRKCVLKVFSFNVAAAVWVLCYLTFLFPGREELNHQHALIWEGWKPYHGLPRIGSDPLPEQTATDYCRLSHICVIFIKAVNLMVP